ncbi:MAG: response regulator [Planctomycetota bacterium]|nr:MAG: response regulator [Planctomycetota bacterium]
MGNLEPVKILLVEDDLGDQKLIKTSLTHQKISNKIFIAQNGEDALDYLSRSKAGDSKSPMPDLILLDLNMPGMGGKEFLRHIKADDQLDTIPVVILTTSDSEQDILESYKLHASGYIKKPVTLDGFRKIMNELEEYWFMICRRVSESQLSCTGN